MAQEHYPVVSVLLPAEAPELIGGREKYWIAGHTGSNLWLLKFPRPGTGEHWAEKVAAEIGRLIGVNCANVELARYVGPMPALGRPAAQGDDDSQESSVRLATICESFLPLGLGPDDSTEQENIFFFHGSELLRIVDEGYDTNLKFGQRDHNIKNISAAMKTLMGIRTSAPKPPLNQELKALTSYALLDGLIGNTDRHHENWMVGYVIDRGERRFKVLPSFDHASSLGRELTDERHRRILMSDGMLEYVRRGRGGVFVDSDSARAPSPLRLAQLLCSMAPDYTRETCVRIGEVSDSQLWDAIDKVPGEFMSEIAKEFAFKLVLTGRSELMRSMR